MRAVIDPDNVEAEFAVLVRSDVKGTGLGHMLMRKMIDFLSRRGTQRLVGDVLRDNEGMRHLARSLGFVLDSSASHSDALRFVLALPRGSGAAVSDHPGLPSMRGRVSTGQ